jgi:hypothetical protein
MRPILGGDERVLLDTRVEEQALLRARVNRGTPSVQLAYPRQGPWSGNNQLGVELPFQPDNTGIQTVLKMDEWGFPEVWTISLGLRINDPMETLDDPTEFFDATAFVDFGIGGIQQTVEVDWVDGTVFSVPMNAINVRARWNDIGLFLGLLPPPGVNISVQIAKGATRHARATRSQLFSVAAGATDAFRPIPPFAKSVILVPRTAASAAAIYAATTELEFHANTSGATPVLTVLGSQLGPTVSFKVPIPALSRFWRIVNGGVVAFSGTAIWNLFEE